jgi:hypothetical protein
MVDVMGQPTLPGPELALGRLALGLACVEVWVEKA